MAAQHGGPRVKDAAEGFALAQRLIAKCAATQSAELDLGGLQLEELPELPPLPHLKRLYLGPDAGLRAEKHLSRFGLDNKRCNELQALPRGFADALPQLEELDLRSNQIDADGAQALGRLTALTELTLGGNHIGDAGAQALGRLSALAWLDLGANEIGDEGVQALGRLTALTTLDLSWNQIGDAGAQALGRLTALTSLDLSWNQIGDEGAQALGRLSALTTLHLANNQIGDVGAQALGRLSALTSLDLRSNQIGDAGAEALGRLSALTRLDLRSNQIGDAGAEALGRLSALTTLDLWGNQIGDVGAHALGRLTALTWLDLSGNQIGDAGAQALGRLTALTWLNLWDNQIGDAGAQALGRLTALTWLDLSNNQIGAGGARALGRLTALTSLDLSWNQIGDAGAQALGELSAVTKLKLDHNLIGDEGAQALGRLSALTWLDLGANQIGDAGAKALGRLSALTSLDLRGNQIGDEGAQALGALTALTRLDLGFNQIGADGARALGALTALTSLKLRNNPGGKIPPEVLSQHNCIDQLRAYLSNLDRGAPVALRDVKLMILGNGQIGKTQLRRRLRREGYDPDIDSTHGVEIVETSLQIAPRLLGNLFGLWLSADEADIPLKIWDFGGQDIYLGTHALFLRSRAIFPILWTETSERERFHDDGNGALYPNFPLEYWLRYVSKMAGRRSPVILIQNQVDQPDQKRPLPVESALLEELLDFPPQSVAYSAKHDTGRDGVLDAMREAIGWQRSQHAVYEIGEGWNKVKQELERRHARDQRRRPARRRDRTLSFDAFAKICRDKGDMDSEADMRVLLGFLHDIGAVFFAKRRFNDQIILDQQWALDAIYALFDREQGVYRSLLSTRGEFTRPLLDQLVWSAFSDADQLTFLEMMKSCDICFPLSRSKGEDTTYVAPELLPERPPFSGEEWKAWREEDVAAAQFEFSFLPRNLFRGVMAKIGSEAGRRANYWRSGLAFQDRTTGAEALIEQVVPGDGRSGAGSIEIRCRGGAAEELLQRLCELVSEQTERIGVTPDKQPKLDSATRRDAPDQDAQALRGISLSETAPYQDRADPKAPKQETCFVSYARAEQEPAISEEATRLKTLGARLRGEKLDPIIDKERLPYGGSVRRYMEINARSDKFVLILSAKFSRSPFCMYELEQIFNTCRRDRDEFHRRTRVIMLEDADIRDAAARAAIQEHWLERKGAAYEELKNLDAHAAFGDLSATHDECLRFAAMAVEVLPIVADACYYEGPDAAERLSFDPAHSIQAA